MKRPILSRILAVLLLLISIPMLVSGFYGLYTASRDRRRSEAEIESLLDTAEEYRFWPFWTEHRTMTASAGNSERVRQSRRKPQPGIVRNSQTILQSGADWSPVQKH